MGNWQFAIVLVSIYLVGRAIINKLPEKTVTPVKVFEYLPSETDIIIRVDKFFEKKFDVLFLDDWNVGRGFDLHGSVIDVFVSKDWHDASDFDVAKGARIHVEVYPSPDWFASSTIGRIDVTPRGVGRLLLSLPFQIARHVLDDFRRNKDQVVSLGVRRIVYPGGKAAYDIVSFEFEEAYD